MMSCLSRISGGPFPVFDISLSVDFEMASKSATCSLVRNRGVLAAIGTVCITEFLSIGFLQGGYGRSRKTTLHRYCPMTKKTDSVEPRLTSLCFQWDTGKAGRVTDYGARENV